MKFYMRRKDIDKAADFITVLWKLKLTSMDYFYFKKHDRRRTNKHNYQYTLETHQW